VGEAKECESETKERVGDAKERVGDARECESEIKERVGETNERVGEAKECESETKERDSGFSDTGTGRKSSRPPICRPAIGGSAVRGLPDKRPPKRDAGGVVTSRCSRLGCCTCSS
jgi:uncharacterized protein YjbJ (UPF0337 family)